MIHVLISWWTRYWFTWDEMIYIWLSWLTLYWIIWVEVIYFLIYVSWGKIFHSISFSLLLIMSRVHCSPSGHVRPWAAILSHRTWLTHYCTVFITVEHDVKPHSHCTVALLQRWIFSFHACLRSHTDLLLWGLLLLVALSLNGEPTPPSGECGWPFAHMVPYVKCYDIALQTTSRRCPTPGIHCWTLELRSSKTWRTRCSVGKPSRWHPTSGQLLAWSEG